MPFLRTLEPEDSFTVDMVFIVSRPHDVRVSDGGRCFEN
jgi:hypothetical protein